MRQRRCCRSRSSAWSPQGDMACGTVMERIGVIGLGRMGRAMAARLAERGAAVTGWTRSGLSAEDAAQLGIQAAGDIGALCAASDIILTSLFDDAAVKAVLAALSDEDLTGKLILETSTVSPEIVKAQAPHLDAEIMDAPIAGGPEMLTNATCTFFLGGSEAAAARAEPVLALISGARLHVGPLGAGMTMKAIVNAQLNVYFAGLWDTLAMARRAEIPIETALTILAKSPAGMPMVKARLPRLLGEDDSVGFSAAGALKDVSVFADMVRETGQGAPSLDAARHAWAQLDGDPEAQDVAALIRQAYRRG
ncbi:NAD(P)-dependent oxidoreductase [Gymnodinialimonas sp. 2305UL16-5]|uniref:NAD(P)-dependent oxidoreductase n=1 Tax=Gymnodinialimonas mytili TaxID=3126503 RepID=UPI0030B157EF